MLAPTPLCPRCGYDQSGLTDSWETHCPLLGTCSECGLDFEWVDVWRPDRETIPGFFEHSRRVRQFMWWPLRTLWMALRPWSFWARVRLSMNPRIVRLAAWAPACTFGAWVLSSALGTLLALPALLAPPPAPGAPGWGGVTEAIDRLFNAWAWPLAYSRSFAWRGGPVRDVHVGWVAALVMLLAAWAMWPVVFAALGDTLRTAKVKRRHVFRAACYSLAFIPALVLARPLLLLINDDGSSGQFVLPSVLVAGCWLQLWWFFAIRRGFQLPAAGGAWAVLCLPSVLAAWIVWAVVASFHPRWL